MFPPNLQRAELKRDPHDLLLNLKHKRKAKKKKSSRFDQLKAKLAKRPGVENPGALTAYIGRQKFGAAGMAKKSAAGRRH